MFGSHLERGTVSWHMTLDPHRRRVADPVMLGAEWTADVYPVSMYLLLTPVHLSKTKAHREVDAGYLTLTPLAAQSRPPRTSTSYCERGPIGLRLHHGITLARKLFKLSSVEHRDLAACVLNDAQFLQLAGGFGDALASHAEHVGYELLRHGQSVVGQPVKRQE